MSAALLIPAVIVALYAALKAAKDTINDHWEMSVFYRLAGASDTSFWGHRDTVWLRRHVDHHFDKPKRRAFRVPVLSHALEAVWDFWHLASTVQIALLLVGLVFVPALNPWSLLPLWLLYYAAFELSYRKVFI